MNEALCLLAAVTLGASGAARPAPSGGSVGSFLSVRGRVVVHRGAQSGVPARLSTLLRRGDVVRVAGRGSAEVVLYENGARFSLGEGSVQQVERLGLKPRSGPPPRRLSPINLLFVRALRRPAPPISPTLYRLLGAEVRDPDGSTQGPRLPSPNGAVRATPVTLRWKGPVGEAESLHVQISDGARVLYEKEELSPEAREIPVPAGVLRPGRWYVWSVTAVQGIHNGPACAGLLRVLEPGERAAVERLEREAAALRASAPDDPTTLLLLGPAYERFGLFEEAQAAYQEVLRLRPDDEGARGALKHLQALVAGKSSIERR